MICKEDCIAFAGLTAEEIDAIAEHEHLGEIGAAALADYLLHLEHGAERIRHMMVDDIRDALMPRSNCSCSRIDNGSAPFPG